MAAKCTICEKVYANQSTLNRHVREVHKQIPPPIYYGKSRSRSYRCLEQNCEHRFPNNKILIEHLQEVHMMNFETEFYNMHNLQDFENWKSEIEIENNCVYILKSKRNGATGEILNFNCYKSKSRFVAKNREQKSRLQNSQGSGKMGNLCTSTIKVVIQNNKLFVEWQKNHYGHTFALRHINLKKQDKNIIGSKLINGFPQQRGLESTCDNFGEHIKRLDLLTAKDIQDIQDIKRSSDIESKDGKRSSNDAFSVDLWVQECKNLEQNPVLLETADSESTCLVNVSTPKHCQASTKTQYMRNKLEAVCTKLKLLNYQDISDEIISEIHHHLLIISNLLDCPQLFQPTSDFENTNMSLKSHIDPQIRCFSTKKKSVQGNPSFMKPINQELHDIKENLLYSNEESFIFISVSPSHDHQY